jgi:RTA1 like protein
MTHTCTDRVTVARSELRVSILVQDKITLGSWITVAGLAIQLFSFAFFTFLATWVQKRNNSTVDLGTWHRRTYIGIYSTIFLITVRNVYRFVEFVQGAVLTWPYSDGTFVISESEPLFYTLDTLPILACFVCYVLFNPARLLPKPEEDLPATKADEEQANGGLTASKVEPDKPF